MLRSEACSPDWIEFSSFRGFPEDPEKIAVGIEGVFLSCLDYLCTRPEPSPPASFSTSATVTKL